jgi:hypothetical protein
MRIPLPELVRDRPSRDLVARYTVAGQHVPPDFEARLTRGFEMVDGRVATGLIDGSLSFDMPWSTLVFGFIARDVDELVELSVRTGPEGSVLELRCGAEETHDAHAIGAAAIVAFAVLAWFAGGLLVGATVLICGGFWTDVARTWALSALERRIQRAAVDLGREVWPN